MFKLKPGNVIQKLNSMDRKQAYTWGAVGVGVIIALLLLASFLGNAEEESFDGFQARGYDLANSPFVTDEAEEFLLASKYPDMKDNNANTIYSETQKEARQEEDAQNAAEEEETANDRTDDYSSGRAYGGRRGYGGGGSRNPTQVGQLGGASMSQASGSNIGGGWGAPRVDTTPYQKNKFENAKIATARTSGDGRRSMAQFASASQAGARLKENKAVNQKRALMGGEVAGTGGFKEDGSVDMSNVTADMLDTNAPQTSGDLDNIDEAVSKAGEEAKKKDDEEKEEDKETLLDKLQDMVLDLAKDAAKKALNSWLTKSDEQKKNEALAKAEQNKLNQQADAWLERPSNSWSETDRNNFKNLYCSGKYNCDSIDWSSSKSPYSQLSRSCGFLGLGSCRKADRKAYNNTYGNHSKPS